MTSLAEPSVYEDEDLGLMTGASSVAETKHPETEAENSITTQPPPPSPSPTPIHTLTLRHCEV